MEYQPDTDIEPLLREILAAHFPQAPVDEIRFVGNGSVNAVYSAHVGNREVILRLADVRYRADEPAKEAWCLERAAGAGVPGPQVFAVGTQGRTVYMVQEFAPGVRGDDASVDPVMVWRELGRYARSIHGIDYKGFCNRDDLCDGVAEAEWARFVAYGLESLTPDDALITLGVYRLDQQPRIRAVFNRLQGQPFHFGLNHGDLSLWNTIVRADGRIILFDWGCACVDIVPHIEISSILRWLQPDDAHFRAFLDGYELSPHEWSVIQPQIDDFQLLKSFDLVRWSIDRRPEQIADYVARAQQHAAILGPGADDGNRG